MIPYCDIPKNISMFAVSSPKTLLLCLSCGFFISRLFGVAALAALPQWVSALSAEACLWRDEERAASFFCPIQQYSVMPKTLNPEHREKRSTPLHTCSSYENARRNRLAAYRRLSRNFPIGAVHPEKLFMFAVSYISKERDTASNSEADFLYPRPDLYRYSTPSPSVNAPAAPCECMTEGKAVPSFYLQPNKHISEMSYTEKDVCRGSVVSPSDTCSSHENARLRLTFLRQSIKSWMETAIRSEFPEATKTRSRLRKLPHGRVRYCASVRSHGIYLSFSTYSLTAFSAAVTRAGAKHRIHHNSVL